MKTAVEIEITMSNQTRNEADRIAKNIGEVVSAMPFAERHDFISRIVLTLLNEVQTTDTLAKYEIEVRLAKVAKN